jgi:hypothetical protein
MYSLFCGNENIFAVLKFCVDVKKLLFSSLYNCAADAAIWAEQ